MPIEWKPSAEYADQRHEAERRIAARDPDDWPTVALALALKLPVWSQGPSATSQSASPAGVRRRRPAADRESPSREAI